MRHPTDSKLYAKIKAKVKARVQRWPSAYASGQVVQQYKTAFAAKHPGKQPYTTKKPKSSPLERWYRERWVNLCKPKKGGGYMPCGRQQMKGNYPFCRPSKRISKDTPTTVDELVRAFGKAKITERCARKQHAKQKTLKKLKDTCRNKTCRLLLTRGNAKP